MNNERLLRHEPRSRRKSERLRRVRMTLCLAAACYEGDEPRLVLGADKRAEVSWAGGNVAFKFRWAGINWPALIAGDVSSADDFLATCRSTFDVKQLTTKTIFDALNEVS